MLRRFSCLLFAACVVLGLSSCGGGGGGGGSKSESTVVQGTVAVGEPLAGMEVLVVPINRADGVGYPAVTATTDAQGRYWVDAGVYYQPPYLVIARGAPATNRTYPTMASISMTAGTINVTPLTDLLVTALLQKPSDGGGVRTQDVPLLKSVDAQKIQAARQQVVDFLLARPSKVDHSFKTPVDASGIADFVKTPFQPVAGDPYDNVLEALNQTLQDDENIFALQEQMLNRSATLLDLQTLASGMYVCSGNLCGKMDANGSPSAPYFSKTSVIQSFLAQIAFSNPGLNINCGASPGIAGFVPNQNNVHFDDTVFRLNFDGYALELTALSFNVYIQIGDTATIPSSKYISMFSGSTSPIGDTTLFDASFDDHVLVTSMYFSQTRNSNTGSPVTTSVSCSN